MTKIPDPETDTGAQVAGAPGGPGLRLRAAREARKLSIAEVSSRLRLDAATLSALENNDFEGLPAPIFVRGYLRNYARLLGMNETEVVAEYDAQGVPEPRPTLNAISRRRIGVDGFPWRLLGWIVVLALAIAGVVLYGPHVNKLWSSGGKTQAPAGALVLPGAPTQGQPTVRAAPGQPSATSIAPPSLASKPVAAPPGVQAAPGAPSSGQAAPTTSARPVPAASGAEPASTGKAATGEHTLTLKFNGDSWTEVRDSTGKRLLFGLIRAGEQKDLTGQPPFSVLLGNSPAVTVDYDGKVFDQSRYNQGHVARFQVGEAPGGR